MKRTRTTAAAAALSSLLCLPALVGGMGQGFHFVEESERLGVATSPPGTSTTDVDLVDIDGDGDLDLLTAEGTDSLATRPNRLLINDGSGVFTDESSTRLLYPNMQNSAKIDTGDCDGDGDLDIISAGVLGEDLLVNLGSGVFQAENHRIPPPIVIPPQNRFDISADARFVDIDLDGDLDLLIANENPFNPSPTGGDQNRLWINDGACEYSDATATSLPSATDQTATMLAGDIDGDGDVDLVVLNRGQDFVYVNDDGLHHFVDETAARFPVTSDSTRGGALVDVDGDGDLDVIAGNSRNQPVALYLNDGFGFFSAAPFGHVPFDPETISGLEVADVDGDGDPDVYLPNAGGFQAGHGFLGGPDRYYRNNGRGVFEEQTAHHFGTPVDDPTTDAAFGDVDGDGDLDLVTGNSDPNGAERLFIRRHNGTKM